MPIALADELLSAATDNQGNLTSDLSSYHSAIGRATVSAIRPYEYQ